MAASNDVLFRQIAMIAGGGASKSLEVVLDRTEDVILLVLQTMAARSIDNHCRAERLAQVSKMVSLFSRGSFVTPIIVGRVVSATTYLGLCVGDATLRRTIKMVSNCLRSE
ncbi:MAG: hypothetical protein DMF66_13255 [Acidobacteria bacterium]|nr:MAG: hypothetical protein DMF66_13255 [Acidobacteriota bacterium]